MSIDLDTSDVSLDARFFCLFKGDPKSGKSIAAASFPNPYIFDMDHRIKAVVNYWRPRGKEFKYGHFFNSIEVIKKLEEFKRYCPYQTLIFDGITSTSDLLISDMIGSRGGGDKREKVKRIIRGGIEVAQIEDYGGESRGLSIILDALVYISLVHNVHVVVIAHILETSSTDIKTKVTTVSRTLLTAGKKIAAKLPKDFDEAYHFDVQVPMEVGAEPRYTCITRHVGTDWAGTALPLPMRMDFTNGSLYDLMMGEISKYDYIKPIQHSAEPLPESDIAHNLADLEARTTVAQALNITDF